ncbi:MAG: DUF11 domain-containing protein [Xanthomonadales bacterium]|nr:DUF11 domain-containing protein [Xanthomonadales bacterium]
MTKTDGVNSVIAGTAVSYQINVVNNGPSDAPQVRVLDALPPGLSAATWTCTATGTTCPANGSGSPDFVAAMPAGGQPSGRECHAFVRSHRLAAEHGDGAGAGRGGRSAARQQFGHRHRPHQHRAGSGAEHRRSVRSLRSGRHGALALPRDHQQCRSVRRPWRDPRDDPVAHHRCDDSTQLRGRRLVRGDDLHLRHRACGQHDRGPVRLRRHADRR